MKILYDYQGFLQRAGGVSRSLCEIIKRLQPKNDILLGCPFTRNVHLKEILGLESPITKSIPYFKIENKLAKIIDITYCYNMVKRNDFDIFHPTFDRKFYYGQIIKRPYIITVHDMIPELIYSQNKDKYYKVDEWLRNKEGAIKNATRIICVSEYTRKTLLEHYSFLDSDKINVVHHGINTYKGDYTDNFYGRYILYVGARSGYKNYKVFLKAIVPLLNLYKDIRVVCTGSPFNTEEINYISSLNLINRVVNVGFVNEDVLASLYYNAQLFVYPSYYEGFGIPILEAFSNNCPACIANTSCFPEVGGNAVEYFDPYDMDSIFNSIKRVIEDSNYANNLRKKGKERVIQYSWDETAQKTYECYKKAIEI